MRLLVTTIYTRTKRTLFLRTSIITVRTCQIVDLSRDASTKEIVSAVGAAIDNAQPSPEHVLISATHCVI